MTEAERYLAKARESLASARADVRARRYNSAANRGYYAAFQAAVTALILAGIRPENDDWSHRFVMSQFSGKLIRRRKLQPARLRGTLDELFNHRVRADYSPDNVSSQDAKRAVKRTGQFVETVSASGETPVRETRAAYGSKRAMSARATRAKAKKLIEEVQQRILRKYPDCEFAVIERTPKDYRLIVRGGTGELEDIHDVLYGRTSDILVDHDIWIVILAEGKREAA